MTRREFFGMGAVGLAILAARALTPFRVTQNGYELTVSGPLHRFCSVKIDDATLKPKKQGLRSSLFCLDTAISDPEKPVTVTVSMPMSPFDWSMVIHPFEPGF